MFDRTSGRAENAVVLPKGWELTNSSYPVTVSRTEDGRVRLDFNSGRPDELEALFTARRVINRELTSAGDHIRNAEEAAWWTQVAVCRDRIRQGQLDELFNQLHEVQTEYQRRTGELPPSGFVIIESSCAGPQNFGTNRRAALKEIAAARKELAQP